MKFRALKSPQDQMRPEDVAPQVANVLRVDLSLLSDRCDNIVELRVVDSNGRVAIELRAANGTLIIEPEVSNCVRLSVRHDTERW